MESRNKKLTQILVAIVLTIAGLSVAFAALSATLNITTSSVKQNPVEWDVGFVGSSATPTAGGSSSVGRTCTNATVSKTQVTIASGIELSKPGDSCTYQLTIKNDGDIAAYLNSITPTAATGTGVSCTTTAGSTTTSAKLVCGNITYTLAGSANGNTNFVTGTTLNASQSTTVYLIAAFTGTTPASTQVTQSGAAFAINYIQK